MNKTTPVIAVMNDWGTVAGIFEDLGAEVLDIEYTHEVSRGLRHADALVLTGGGDINPERYTEEERHPQVYGVSEWRDTAEFAAVRMARKLRIPVLGICRGHQLINVSMGGTLHQHIYENAPHLHKHDGSDHPVKLRRTSFVGRRLGGILKAVTSLHHQAVDRLGDGLVPVGWAVDGTVEMIETAPGVRPYMLGTQFHPEMDVKFDGYDADAIFQVIFDKASQHRISLGKAAPLAEIADLIFGQKKVMGYGVHGTETVATSAATSASETTRASVDRYMYDTRDIAYWDDDEDSEDSYEAWQARNRVALSKRSGLGTLQDADNLCMLSTGCKSPYDCLDYGSCAAECVSRITKTVANEAMSLKRGNPRNGGAK